MSRAELLEQAQAASAVGCKEALFTLGDKPELRYEAAREGLRELGHETTLSYLAEAARLVFEESGLLPHLNPGLMTPEDFPGATSGVGIHGPHARERVRSADGEG